MATPKIYIGSYDVGNGAGFGQEHTYLYYDPDTDGDGDPTTGTDMEIIRGGPQNPEEFVTNPGLLIVEAGVSSTTSADRFDLETPDDRNFRTLFQDTDAATKWTAFKATAQTLGEYDSETKKSTTDIDYPFLGFGTNSNSVINTILAAHGIDFRESTPFSDGITSDYQDAREFPGHMTIIDGSGADSYTAFAHNNTVNEYTTFIDRADVSGKDTIRVEAGAQVRIMGADGNAPTGSIDIVLTDVAGGVTLVQRSDGSLSIRIDGVERVHIQDGIDASADLILKYDNGTTVTTLKDMSNLTSADFESAPTLTLLDVFGNSLAVGAVFALPFIPVFGFWDPLVVDLDDDGFEPDLIGFEQYFDHAGDGFAELTAWSGGGNAFLARDINENGRIDNGTELFGTATTNGFEALAAFDLNADGIINSSDAVWADLILWRDANGDAQTQSDELLTLSSQNITGFELDTVEIVPGAQQDLGPALLTHTGTALTTTGTLDVGNLIFDRDEQNSVYADDYTLDLRVLGLPNVIGHSKYADLHIAMSLDNDTEDPDSLLSIMQDIASYSFIDALAEYDAVKEKVGLALFRWMGVDGVDPESRGPFLEDGRIVDFILRMVNGEFVDTTTGSGQVGAVQAIAMQDMWDTILRQFTAKIIFQSVGSELYDDSLTYNFFTESITGTPALSQTAVDALEAHALGLANTAARQAFWVNVLDYVYDIQTAQYEGKSGFFGDLTVGEETMLNDAIEASDANLTWYKEDHSLTGYPISIEHRVFNPVGSVIEGDNTANISASDPSVDGTAADDTMYGYGGDDILNGHAGNDVIYGGDGNDELIGEGGTDILYGGAGNDILNAGIGVNGASELLFGEDGDDTLYAIGGNGAQILANGGAGDDLYYAGNNAWITDSSGFDTIHFYAQSVAANIIWKRYADDTLHMNLGGDNVYVQNFFNNGDAPIELLTFAHGSTEIVDMTALTHEITTYGTAAGETIEGIEEGASNVDTIYAGGGNDTISAGSGNDTVYGEDGNDVIDGGDGDDTLTGGAGYDVYVASAGTDTIWGTVDGLSFTNGTTFEELEFVRLLDDNDRLRLEHDTGTIIVEMQFWASWRISDLQFSNGFAINMSDVSITTLGTEDADTIWGVFIGGSPNDIIYAYGGNDTIHANSGNDIIYAGDGDDTVAGGSGFNLVYAGAGADTITSAGVLHGEDGDDIISASAGSGINELYGGAGNDTLTGSSGNDVLDGGAGNDAMSGAAGNDAYHYSGGLDSVTDTGGTDVLIFSSDYHVDDLVFQRVGFNAKIVASSGVNEITTDARFSSFSNGEHLRVDTLEFHDGFTLNWLYYWDSNTGLWNEGISAGDAYENILLGLSSADTIDADAGDDTVHGRAGNDIIYGKAGIDRLHGGDGDDTIHGGADNDTIWGGEGNDTISFANAAALVTASLLTGTASGEGSDTFTGIENITGSAYGDTLTGDDNANVLTGLAGNDSITAGGGDDTIEGGAGDDALSGGDGVDTAVYSSAGSAVTINLTAGTATGGDGNDTLSGIENVVGSTYDDTITGDVQDNVLEGGAGNDTIFSAGGSDTVLGGDGDDEIHLGAGLQVVTGGDGADTYVVQTYSEQITITDFDVANDIIDLRAFTAIGSYAELTKSASGSDSLITLDGTIEILLEGVDFTTELSTINYLFAGNNVIDGTSGNDTLTGTAGNDTINGLEGADTISGGAGDDILIGGTGNDSLNGGDDFDTADYSTATSAVSVNLSSGIATGGAGTDTLTAIEKVIGSSYNDTLTGGTAADTLSGGGGNDTLNGGDGNDILDGGVGWDHINGGSGTDTALYSATSTGFIVYRDNSGWISVRNTVNSDTDRVYNDVEQITFTDVTLDLTSMTFVLNGEGWGTASPVYGTSSNNNIYGFAAADIIYGEGGNDNIDGRYGDDELHGGDGADNLDGEEGDDVLYGDAGNDELYGGDGDDTLIGGAGYDNHHGGAGNDSAVYNVNSTGFIVFRTFADFIYVGNPATPEFDKIYNDVEQIVFNDATLDLTTMSFVLDGLGWGEALPVYGNSSSNIINGYNAIDTIYGEGGNDTLRGYYGDDELHGGDGSDTVYGGHGADVLYGDAGNDQLYGDAGDDTLYGGINNDTLYGGDGADLLYGNIGTDTLNGQGGADTFVFMAADVGNGSDTIVDFSLVGEDVIDIADILSAHYDPLTDAITDFVQITDNGTHSFLKVDVDGGANNFVQIAQISNVTGLTDEAALVTSGHLLAA